MHGGACQCPTGEAECGTPSICVNVQKSVANCGACNNKCGPGGSCSAGVCTCGTGLTLCGGPSADGGTDAGADASVGDGGSSDAGTSVGKCVDFQTDPNNCGGCSIVCEGGTCNAGACQ